MPTSPLPIIIDTDPGLDDAVAILFALRAAELDVRALTVVQGNCSVEHGAQNARRILQIAKRCDVPVVVGAAQPLVRQRTPGWIGHGREGFGDFDDVTMCDALPHRLNAVRFLSETLLAAPEPITLLPIAPLTNIALALAAEPAIKTHIKEIIMMGGAVFRAGNTTPAAEFNILGDPEAAQMALTSGVPLTMVGLDVTMQTMVREPEVRRLEASSHPAAQFAARCARYTMKHTLARYGDARMHLHDPLAIGVALDRSLAQTRRLRVEVETATGLSLGRTIADERGLWGKEPNVEVCVEVDAERFVALLLETLTK
jgi:purine nucleosidase